MDTNNIKYINSALSLYLCTDYSTTIQLIINLQLSIFGLKGDFNEMRDMKLDFFCFFLFLFGGPNLLFSIIAFFFKKNDVEKDLFF